MRKVGSFGHWCPSRQFTIGCSVAVVLLTVQEVHACSAQSVLDVRTLTKYVDPLGIRWTT